MKSNLTRENLIRRKFKRLTDEGKGYTAHLNRLRGNIGAKALLVAPPPGPEEFEKEMPFCRKTAVEFHQLLLHEAGIDTNRHTLVLPASWLGLKPNKHSFMTARELVEYCADQKFFNLYIAVGKEAFRQIFGDRLAGSPFTAGSVLYPRRLTGTPVLSLPDPAPLEITATAKTRDYYIQLNQRERWIFDFMKLVPTIKRVADETGILKNV